ncbi:MAG TPA: hypothetical protein VJA21_22640 [Verrucomicrobiae bacterium]
MLLLALCCAAQAGDFASLCAARAAIERVYYDHRLGTKPPFEQTLPPATLEALVRKDLKQETVLREHYGVALTPALLQAEVERINNTTRAPEMLAEIKAALGNDPLRFASVFAKPILVERLLRNRFENDDALHAPARRACEAIRAGLLAAKTNGADALQLVAQLRPSGSNSVTETTWQLAPRPAETNAPAVDELEIKKRFGPNAQLVSSAREADRDPKYYFDNLPPSLQNVLRAQLRQAGNISAVIETSGAFLLFVAREKSHTTLTVACLAVPKRSYEQWLQEQQ